MVSVKGMENLIQFLITTPKKIWVYKTKGQRGINPEPKFRRVIQALKDHPNSGYNTPFIKEMIKRAEYKVKYPYNKKH